MIKEHVREQLTRFFTDGFASSAGLHSNLLGLLAKLQGCAPDASYSDKDRETVNAGVSRGAPRPIEGPEIGWVPAERRIARRLGQLNPVHRKTLALVFGGSDIAPRHVWDALAPLGPHPLVVADGRERTEVLAVIAGLGRRDPAAKATSRVWQMEAATKVADALNAYGDAAWVPERAAA